MNTKPEKADCAMEQDADLNVRARLRQWNGVEPCADFESAVWARIRTASADDAGWLRLVTGWFERISRRPAWVSAAAAAAGLVVGIGLAFAVPASREGRPAGAPLLHAQTLAGSYLTVVTRGDR